jgi:hypothetical protein
MDNDITWAYGFTGFAAAKIVEINDIRKIVYIDLIRAEKKRPVAFVALATIIFMIVNLGS